MLYHSASDLDFSLENLPPLPLPRRVLMTTPAHFEVAYVINPHMAGNIGTVDEDAAHAQWQALRREYESLGFDVHTVAGGENLPDMVFCANQTLPYLRPDGSPGVLLSQMHAPQRRDEVPFYRTYFSEHGYTVETLPPGIEKGFEGMGDALWHAGRRLLWGGYGFRTGLKAYEEAARLIDAPIVVLRLDDPDFYHLDTCLSLLDARTALYVPAAFQPDGLALLRALVPNLIEVPEDEARSLLACNAHCPDGKRVLIQQGCAGTNEKLRAAGFEPVEVDTGEFLKSGGSVFCMKLMHW